MEKEVVTKPNRFTRINVQISVNPFLFFFRSFFVWIFAISVWPRLLICPLPNFLRVRFPGLVACGPGQCEHYGTTLTSESRSAHRDAAVLIFPVRGRQVVECPQNV